MKLPHAPSLAALTLALIASIALAWLAQDAPVEPGWARGLLRADGLSALVGVCTVALALADAGAGRRPARLTIAAGLLVAGYLTTHLAVLGVALLAAALTLGWRRPAGVAAALAVAAGLALIALRAGVWRYPAPVAGLGLNSLSFALMLGGALLACGAPALPLARPGAQPAPAEPLLAAGCLYAILRLFALGPWNLGWLYATMLLAAGAALWAAGRAASGPPGHAAAWLTRFYLALGLAGAGMASGAGVALAAFALLALAALRLGLAPPTDEARAIALPASDRRPGSRRRALWLLAGALPFSAPFTAAWAGVAGALAGGLSLLAAALWAAALLATLPVARAAEAGAGDDVIQPAEGWRLWAAAGLSLGLGVGAPALAWLLVEPAVGQLQAGLTPFGELALWPWAGLIAMNSARQPVATLPSLALAALMLVLGALAWAVVRLIGRTDA
jgi:hypothetical protein